VWDQHLMFLCCRDKPREASDEERQAALYNTACCLGAMGNTQVAHLLDAEEFHAGCTSPGQCIACKRRPAHECCPLCIHRTV
jgi:hypothetical protein